MRTGKRLQFWIVVGVLVVVTAAALALTSPKDHTRFVKAPTPKASHARSTAAGASARSAAPAARQPAAKTLVVAAADPPAPKLAAAVPADPPAAREADAPLTDSRIAGAATRRDLFQPLVARTSGAGGLPPASLPPFPPGADGLVPLPDVFGAGGKQKSAYWSYVGTVQLDSVTYALIEEKKTKAGVYLRKGDTFRGGHVELIRPEYVVMAVAGKRYTLPKSRGMAPTVEEAAAAAAGTAATAAPAVATSAPAQPGVVPPGGVPGQPGMVPGGYPGQPGAPQPAFMDPPLQGQPGYGYQDQSGGYGSYSSRRSRRSRWRPDQGGG